jgi:hypothetical protein
MSLFDNPKSSDYFKFNGRLYYLEQTFKNYLKENNATPEDISEVINNLKSNGIDLTNLSSTIKELEYNVLATKDNGFRKVIGIDNIKVETTFEINYYYYEGLFDMNAITYGEDNFIIVGLNGKYGYVPNNINAGQFRITQFPASTSMLAIAYGKGTFVAFGNNGIVNIYKQNSTSWESSSISTSNLTSIVYGNNQFVITGAGGELITYSPDIGFKTRTSPVTGSNIRCIAYKKGKFMETEIYMAVADGGKFIISPNGVGWMKSSIPLSSVFYSIVYGNGIFVLVGDNGKNPYDSRWLYLVNSNF